MYSEALSGMSSSTIQQALQVTSVTVSLVASGGIAALSIFDIPELKEQPASRSLPGVRWLFSRGSHIFPGAAFVSAAGFVGAALGARSGPIREILRFSKNGLKVNGLLAAAALAFSIAPFTMDAMIPVNFTLIKKNEELGGFRSEKAASLASTGDCSPNSRSASDSVEGKSEGSEFTDLSGPQEKTKKASSAQDDAEVRKVLGQFGRLNLVRAFLIGLGGIVGLVATSL